MGYGFSGESKGGLEYEWAGAIVWAEYVNSPKRDK